MKYLVTLPENIKKNETIVLPISMHQPLERGEKLNSILESLTSQGYKQQTTILVCDSLNRHNCSSEVEALKQGDDFLNDHKEILSGFRILRWSEFIDSCYSKYQIFFEEVCKKSEFGSRFYNKMKKTWEKCLSANYSLESSIHYQQEEYAAILCMSDLFNHLIYPKRITNGMAYLYSQFAIQNPIYHHVKISEKKTTPECIFSSSRGYNSKDKRHLHIAFRAVIEQVDTLLKSDELSDKAKKIFAEEIENLLMLHGVRLEYASDIFPVKSNEIACFSQL